MRKLHYIILFLVLTGLIASFFILEQVVFTNKKVKVTYPWEEAVFPADFSAPTFRWAGSQAVSEWTLNFGTKNNPLLFAHKTGSNHWKPLKNEWDSIKKTGFNQEITLTIEPVEAGSKFFTHKAVRHFSISADSVDSPVFYRQIPLPFSFAESNMEMANYSLYNVASYEPPHKVLDKFDVCGNCHSSTQDGSTIALDFDASHRDKGGYFIAPIDSVTKFNKDNYMSWSKLQDKSTFGLFSKISWGGRYVVTTIKDRVISKKWDETYTDKLEYSQVFFPVNGVLAVYDRETDKIFELQGANDPNFVQSNAIWTPDDKYIIFARAKALPFADSAKEYKSFVDDPAIVDAYVSGERKMLYDLYMVPFNEGRGGVAHPVKGASGNGKSNYFPAISPNGEWLAYCQADNLMMLRPDSKLYMVSMKTGASEQMHCNFNSMNSWHAWSPNGKWLVFVSKALNIYTDMFLTHIDAEGKASTPVLLENAHDKNKAVNYPEFINISPDFEFVMEYNYVNLKFIIKTLELKQDTVEALRLLNDYIAQDQFSTPKEYEELAFIYDMLNDAKKRDYYFKMAQEKAKVFYKIN